MAHFLTRIQQVAARKRPAGTPLADPPGGGGLALALEIPCCQRGSGLLAITTVPETDGQTELPTAQCHSPLAALDPSTQAEQSYLQTHSVGDCSARRHGAM